MGNTKIIASYSAKGGVGKTTSVINLAAIYALKGKKVLLIDLDQQANLSYIFLNSETFSYQDLNNIEYSLLNLLIDGIDVKDVLKKSNFNNIDIIPCVRNGKFAEENLNLSKLIKGADTLKLAIQDIIPNYDYIFLDCPPSLAELTINALVVANSVIVPIKSDIFSVLGISKLVDKVKEIKLNYNDSLDLTGIFLTMANSTNLNKEVVNILEEQGNLAFKTTIRNSISVPESTYNSLPVVSYKPKSSVTNDYYNLADEIDKRIKSKGNLNG